MPKILIVDDQVINRHYLKKLLGKSGHRLLEAADGAEALRICQSERPDLVICDILMPTMDGFEFVRRLREDPALAKTIVFFYTASYRQREALALAASCGVRQVILKPSKPDVILQAVDAALGLVEAPKPCAPPANSHSAHLTLLTGTLMQKVNELEQANQRLAALLQLVQQLTLEHEPAKLLECFCSATRDIVSAKYAAVGILAPGGDDLGHFAVSGVESDVATQLGVPSVRAGLLSRLLLEGGPVRLWQASVAAENLGLPPANGAPRSFLGTAVSSARRVYGILYLVDKVGATEFSPADEQVLVAIAAELAVVYENSLLHQELKERAADLEERARLAALSGEIGVALTRSGTLRDMLRLCAESMVRNLSTALARIWTLDPTGNLLELQASAGLYTHLDGQHSQIAVGQRRVGRIAQERRAQYTADLVHDSRISDPEWVRREGLVAFAGYPLLLEDRLLGVVTLFSRQPLSEGARSALAGVANQIALGIERKHSEGSLRAAEARLRYVITSSPTMLFTVAIADQRLQRITWTSDNLGELLGFELEEALQPGWWSEHVHPEDRERVREQVHAELFSQGRSIQEYRFRHRTGTYRWARDNLRLMRDASGHPVEVVGSSADITDLKQLEDQLRQAQKMEAIGRLAGGVAHDFNNLLTVIKGYGDLLVRELVPGERVHTLISEMVTAGDRAAALTRQLLLFSRKAILEPRIIDMKELVINLDKMLRRIIGEDVQLTVVVGSNLGSVKADPGQIEQVILNLVVNARDAMPRGGRITIELQSVDLEESYLRTHADARTGPHVVLVVTDTGCGMDQATMARAFEPFFTTKGEQGTGLGLATVHGIVKQSGGHVTVYSEVGIGTSFKVYLPCVPEPPSVSTTQSRAGTLPLGHETVLLVEDETGVRGLARHILQRCAYTVLEACDGAEAVRLAEQHQGRIDLVVTDVVMPRLGGRAVAERLAVLQPGVKVLFLSGYTDDAVFQHGILEADVAFLQKPFSPMAFAIKVREVLDEKGH
jgi:PAS domain S-box-containing protein